MKTSTFITKALFAVLICTSSTLYAQVKIGDNPSTINGSAMLEVESTTKGFLPPRMNIPSLNAAAPAVNPPEGLIVYNTNTSSGKGLVYWDGSVWRRFQQSTGTLNMSIHAVGSVYIGDIAAGPSAGLSVQPGSQGFSGITHAGGWTQGNVAHAQWEVTFTNPVPAGKKYFVLITPRSAVNFAAAENQGDIDNDLTPPVVLGKIETGFKIFVQETSSQFAQQLYFDIVVLVEN